MILKDLREFLEGKPDDAVLKISQNENDLPGEDVRGFYYGEELVDDSGDEVKQHAIVISSYIHF